MGDEDAKRASENLRDLLDATAPAATVRELLAATTFAAASLAFAAPAGWNLSVGAVVRLAPGVDEMNGLRPGELATVKRVNSLDCRGNIQLTRRHDEKVLYPYFKRDLQHGLDGWLPLHAAAALNLDPEVVTVLINANRDAASTLDAGGLLPLALALQNNASDEVVMLLGEAAHAAVGADGRTALHLVVAASRHITVIRHVFEADHDAMMAVDADGKKPHQLLRSAHGSELIALFVSHSCDSTALKHLIVHQTELTTTPPSTLQLFTELLEHGVDKERLLLAAADLGKINCAVLCVKRGAGGMKPMPGDDRVARTVGVQSSVRDIALFFRRLGVFYGRYLIREGHPAYRSTTALVLFAEDLGEENLGASADLERLSDAADASHGGALRESEPDAAAAALGVGRNALGDDDVFEVGFVGSGGVCASRNVVLKFMLDQSQWRREMAARTGVSPSDAGRGTNTILDAQFIVQSLPGLEDTDAVAAAVEAPSGALAAFKELYPVGRHVIVMEAGDRSLHEIFEQERPGLNGTRTLFQQVLRAVAYLHKEGFVHGDIKMRNVMRLKHDGRLRLIDLGCAARTQKPGGPASFLGSKFSSATLPPEMLCALNGAQMVKFKKYWTDQRESSSELWSKVEPKRSSKGGHFVVKTYRVAGDDDAPVDAGALPYDLEEATVAVDIWALGMMLYQLCVGEPLMPSTRDEDLMTGDAMEYIANWDDAKALDKALSKVKDVAARHLCSELLRADPMERRKVDLDKLLLTHPFLRPESDETKTTLKRIEKSLKEVDERTKEINERTKEIRGLALETKYELSRGLAALKRLVGAAGEITVPTVFVIKPTAVQSIEKTVALFGALDAALQDPVGALEAALGKDDYELWLCCEVCYMPQTGETGKWPCSMSVSTPGRLEFAARVLPLARAVLQAAVVVNTLGGIGRLLGFPIPEIPTIEAGVLGFLEQETSVAEFRAVEKRLHEAADKAKLADAAAAGPADATKLAAADATADAAATALVGSALREFKRFLDEHDPNRGWCGLSPVFLDEGAKVFCCGACCKALEERPTATFTELRETIGRETIGHPPVTRVAADAPPMLKAPPVKEQPVDTAAVADADAAAFTAVVANAAALAAAAANAAALAAAAADAAALATAELVAAAPAAVAADAGAPAADRVIEALRAHVAKLEARPALVPPAPEYSWVNSPWY